MDVQTVAIQIENKIDLLGRERLLLKGLSDKKAECMAEYEKELAKAIVGLKNGKEYELGGEKIINPPASYTEKIARGLCWEQLLEKDKAEAAYKNLLASLDVLKSQLNAYQSINRHLD